MNSDRSPEPATAKDGFLGKLKKAFAQEPADRVELIETLRESQQRHLLDADALTMIEGVLEVSEMQVRDIMIPRSQMVVVERDAPLKEILPVIVKSAHSRFPVIGDGKDEVEGILLAKDLLPYALNGSKSFNVRDVLRPAAFIPDSKRLNVLLKDFRASRNHMAIVVDEYGGIDGLVTIEDVLEQIVGEIEDEYDFEEDDFIKKHAEDNFVVKALTTVDDFNDFFGSQFSDDEYETIGGLVVHHFGHLPRREEKVDIEGYQFTVLNADNRRVHLLQLTPPLQAK